MLIHIIYNSLGEDLVPATTAHHISSSSESSLACPFSLISPGWRSLIYDICLVPMLICLICPCRAPDFPNSFIPNFKVPPEGYRPYRPAVFCSDLSTLQNSIQDLELPFTSSPITTRILLLVRFSDWRYLGVWRLRPLPDKTSNSSSIRGCKRYA